MVGRELGVAPRRRRVPESALSPLAIYTEERWAAIERTAGIRTPTIEFRRAILRDLEWYVIHHPASAEKARAANVRRLLRELADTARCFADLFAGEGRDARDREAERRKVQRLVLGALIAEHGREEAHRILFNTSQKARSIARAASNLLRPLAEDAEKRAKDPFANLKHRLLPRPGNPRSNAALRGMVRRLSEQYKKWIGKPATRTFNADSREHTGRFPEFAWAVLLPLELANGRGSYLPRQGSAFATAVGDALSKRGRAFGARSPK